MTPPLAFIFSSPQYSSLQNHWHWAVAGVFLGAYWFYRGFCLLQRRRLILDTPASKIRSASIGLVEVSGLASGPYTMQAPITGLPCYYYRTIAWQLKPSGKSKKWEQVADESLHVPFYLDDNTGRMLVNPQGAELDIHRDFHEEYDISLFSSPLNLPANVASFLVRHAIATNQRLKIDEYCIKPKNALFALGTLAPNPGLSVTPTPVKTMSDGPAKFKMNLLAGLTDAVTLDALTADSVTDDWKSVPSLPKAGIVSTPTTRTAQGAGGPEIIRLSSTTQSSHAAGMTAQEKIAAALTKAEISNPAAWVAAGVQYPEVTVTTANSATSVGTAAATAPALAPEFDLNPPAVLMKGKNNPAFFISWRSQREVVRSLGWKSSAMVWGGPALLLASLYVLVAHFGGM